MLEKNVHVYFLNLFLVISTSIKELKEIPLIYIRNLSQVQYLLIIDLNSKISKSRVCDTNIRRSLFKF